MIIASTVIHAMGSATSCDVPKLAPPFTFESLIMKKLYLLVVLLSLSSCLHADDSACIPESESCAECYSVLVSQVIDRDENLLNLEKIFFPPEKASPLFVTVYYQYGDRSYICDTKIAEEDNSTEVWFWSKTLFYMFQPIHVFQYTSLLFSDLKSYSSDVCLILDHECRGAKQDHMQLLTQRVS